MSRRTVAESLAHLDSIANKWVEFRSQEPATSDDPEIDLELGMFPRFRQREMRTWAKGTFQEWKQCGFIVPGPVTSVTPHLYPVVLPLIWCDGHLVKLMVRVAVFCRYDHSDGTSELRGEGWRFDTGDDYVDDATTYRGHYRDHVQRISGWKRNGKKGFRASTLPENDNWSESAPDEYPHDNSNPVSEFRPAIPVPSYSAPGLMLASAVAIHGARAAAEILDGLQLPVAVLREFQTIAYPPNPG